VLLAPDSIADQIRILAREFLTNMRDGHYDQIWNYSITINAMDLISMTAFPLHLQAAGEIDAFLANPSSIQNMSFAFQRDTAFPDDDAGVRTAFFKGLANGLEQTGWYEPFSDEGSVVFINGSAAILIADAVAATRSWFLPFIDEGGRQYRVDFEAIAAFSMTTSAQKLHRLATRALEMGETRSAMEIYELASRMSGAYTRLRQLVWDHPLVKGLVKDERGRELQAEYAYTVLAREQADALLEIPSAFDRPIDMNRFLHETFANYGRILNTEVSEEDLQNLCGLSDQDLRGKVAKILVGVDQIEALREARKPHGPAEIADMEVAVTREQVLFHLLMPFKSGLEVRGNSVPVEVFYQILRPHMFFEKGVVVFITAKPCSQPLMNLIKLSRDRKGWPISVIEHLELAALLRANSLL
jgi:hypothetical protein